MKPTAGKYDFKEKIQQLQDIINPLKRALNEQRQRGHAAREAMGSAQEQINNRLLASEEDAASLRDALEQTNRVAEQRSGRVKELTESLKGARAEQEGLRQ